MKIRYYKASDKEKLISIYDSARKSELLLAGVPDGFISLANEETFGFLMRSTVLVAEVSGRVVGFTAFEKDTLGWLYVSPVHSREGIGTLLVGKAIEEIKNTGVSTLKINVLKGNAPALRLYTKLGFRQEKNATGILPVSELQVHVICMELSL